jgi:hypothetical protein
MEFKRLNHPAIGGAAMFPEQRDGNQQHSNNSNSSPHNLLFPDITGVEEGHSVYDRQDPGETREAARTSSVRLRQ